MYVKKNLGRAQRNEILDEILDLSTKRAHLEDIYPESKEKRKISHEIVELAKKEVQLEDLLLK